MTNPVKIVGGNGKRRTNDFYPTPRECTIALLDFLEKHFLIQRGAKIWEPACGCNNMVDVMEEKGYCVTGTDIIHGQDYFTTDLNDDQYDWIITNPPFSVAQEFITTSAQKGKPFAMLLKSQYWHSAKRKKVFADIQPAFVLPLTWRPDFTGQGGSLLDMMWCVWLGPARVTYYLPLDKPK